jgi:hypothetical protein
MLTTKELNEQLAAHQIVLMALIEFHPDAQALADHFETLTKHWYNPPPGESGMSEATKKCLEDFRERIVARAEGRLPS